jgi:hypothetical protein
MSASKQFQQLTTKPLDRGSRQKGVDLRFYLGVEKRASPRLSESFEDSNSEDANNDDQDDANMEGGDHLDEEEHEEQEDEGNNKETPKGGESKKRQRATHLKKKRSLAHFLHKDGKCVLCCYTQKNNLRTDTLLRHWASEHPTQLEAVHAAQDDGKDVRGALGALIDASRNPKGSIESFVRKKSRLQLQRWNKELGVIRFLIRKKIPFDAVDSVEFEDMLLDFGVSLDGKGVLLDLIFALFEFTLELKRERLKACAGLSVAADFWTSKAGRKYLALAYFGITDSWKLVSEVMDLVRFPGTTKAEVCIAVMEVRRERHVAEDQLIAQHTSDNGADLRRARDLTETDHDDCINHVANGSFGDLMGKDIQMTQDVKTMRHIVATIESDKNLKLCFETLQLQSSDDLTEALEFVHENDTRWLSTILFMERFARFEAIFCNTEAEYHQAVFEHLLAEFPQSLSDDVCTAGFFLRLKGYIEVCKGYKNLQLALQSLKRPTGSLVVPMIGGLIDSCRHCRSSVKGVEEFSVELAASVELRAGRYLQTVTNYLKASLVDPSQCNLVSLFVSEDIINEAWHDIKGEIIAQLAFQNDDMEEELTANAAEYQLTLLRRALKASNISADSEDPLQFYRDLHVSSIDAALIVVRHLLCIPAGESHCERCFSWADGFITKLRNRTGNQALEMQLILYEEFSRLDFDWKTFREDFLTRIAAEFNAKYPEKAPQAKKK